MLVNIVYEHCQLPVYPGDNFISRLNDASFQSMIASKGIIDKLHAIRMSGNRAAHEGKFQKSEPLWILKEAHILSYWLLRFTDNRGNQDPKLFETPILNNTKSARPETETQQNKHKQQLDQALSELEAVKQAEQKAVRENQALKRKLDERKQASFRKISLTAVNNLELNEAETRRKLIDIELHGRGWDIDLVTGKNTEQVTFEEQVDGQPTDSGIGYCDYVLWGDNGKPIAVIEAKRTRENVEKGRQQAKLYADSLESKYGQRPVIFYTNGFDITIWDDAQNLHPRKIYSFYSKDSVEYLIRQRTCRKDITRTPIDLDIAGRDYQIEAISRVCETYSNNQRRALLVQATGTGKTRVSIALTKLMFDAGWAKRVLFLCDRKELRKQAGNAYNEFLSEPLYIVGKSKKADKKNARIYVSTYPGMMRLMQEFDPGYFDLIIADESHRSIYNVYGDLFKYFDAMQLGMTATPVEMISRSTSKLFGCDYKMPTANYPLEQAVADGNLVPFKVVSHTTEFLREGIKGHSLTDEQIAELEEQGIDPNTLNFEAKAIDKAVYNKGTNREILRNLMENGLRLADGQTLGKSMIFARRIEHAEVLSSLFVEMYPEYGGNFCRVIHSKYERAEELIDDFKLNDGSDKQVTIAISVDMLDTGIDVPEVLNLVFAKPVKSKVKFWQMVGRGTRLCENLFGLGNHKTKFLIFDHWQNFDYFELDPDDEEPNQVKSLSQKLFEAKLKYAEEALKLGDIDSFEAMTVLIKQDIDSLDDNSIAIKDNWRIKQQLSDLPLLKQFAPTTVALLKDKLAPLMQWRNIIGQSEAIKFDLNIINAQYAKLLNISKPNPELIQVTREPIIEKIRNLLGNLGQVRAKAEVIKQAQSEDFWQITEMNGLEHIRKELRSVIHLQKEKPSPPPEPVSIYDITEDSSKTIVEERRTNIRTVDYEIYRQEVEKTLAPLFDNNNVLKKLRRGEAITETELESLNSLIHTQNANLDLKLLKEFFPDSAVGTDQLLRTIVGLDKEAIDSQFTSFIQQHHINLTALQQRFLALLKNEICRTGQISIKRLYEQPFSTLHQDGIDGLFQDKEAHLIAEFIKNFEVTSGSARPVIKISASAFQG
jgi:type I restriction enzyme R subunit